MKKFILEISFFPFLAFFLMAVVIASGRNPSSYIASSIDKEDWLAKAGPSKIVLVGGSSVAYSIDGMAMASSTKRPIVNMGLVAGAGLRFMLSEIQDQIKTGDIVLIAPEYEQSNQSLNGGGSLLPIFLHNPAAIRYFTNIKQFTELITGMPYYFQQRVWSLLRLKDSVPDPGRSKFDALGDYLGHLDQPQQEISHSNLQGTKALAEELALINAFADRMKQRGACVVFAFPPFGQSSYEKNQDKIQRFEQELRAGLHVPILLSLPESIHPDTELFDSDYHLGRIGREKRTQVLINGLLKSGECGF